MDKTVIDNLVVRFSDLGLKLLGALAIFIFGRMVIRFALGLLVQRLEGRKVDHTIVGYARNTVAVALNIALVVILLGVLGIETTSFAAFIAGAGLAVGAAWGGLLSNFAAGAFLVILRPFKAGDQIHSGGVTGKVAEVGLFVTTVVTQDNVRTFIGNSKILASSLRNYNANPLRRVDLGGTVGRFTDVDATMAAIRERLLKLPNVAGDPAPEVQILSFNQTHYHLAIRPYAPNDHYWDVYFGATASLRDLLDSIGPHGAEHELESDDELEGEGSEGADGEEED